MRALSAVILSLVCAALLARPAAADMDYRCLRDCVDGGKGSQQCMTQCTYGEPASTPSHRTSYYRSIRSPHDQFTPPMPTSQIHLHSESTPVAPGKDYQCVSQCRQNGYQYQLCDEQCTGAMQPSGSVATPDGGHSQAGAMKARPQTGAAAAR